MIIFNLHNTPPLLFGRVKGKEYIYTVVVDDLSCGITEWRSEFSIKTTPRQS